jgi:hypothetical protein
VALGEGQYMVGAGSAGRKSRATWWRGAPRPALIRGGCKQEGDVAA